ncbi:hypothetical protein [Devosia marina]|uniref:Uncharacterized protein n=1 Tax=Devosia marina TaxID=2683198 RepID=A0A7X3FTJ0_9HYPH|nr:hypothetical protein [Devosia marina]MVT00467.1 hypothetical protein [Devosia marina]
MRYLIAIALLLVAAPAMAQFWTHYTNERYGYELDIPPSFEGGGESDNGDGQAFYRPKSEQVLTVWGGHLLENFEAEVAQRQRFANEQNWAITYQASTPQWAVFSGQRDHRIFYQRMIPLCDGASYAAYRIEYNVRDLAAMEGIIDGLTRSFMPMGC